MERMGWHPVVENSLIKIAFDDPWHGEVITRALDPDQPFREGFDRCISITRGGKLAGGVMFDAYLKRSIQMHVASFMPNWLTRDFLWVIFDYPFNQLGVDVIYGPVDSTNKHAIDFDKKIGFKEETRLKNATPGGDLIILSMYRADCRWLSHTPKTLKGTA